MSYFSTRGKSIVTASQAVLAGLAPDGGLYVPAIFPQISVNQLADMQQMPYTARAAKVLQSFLEDFSPAEIDTCVHAAYRDERFDDPAIAPLRRLDVSTWMLELYHGSTLAFKDMALQLLPHLITLAARKNGESREISILVATSGDTGKAALEGFRNVPGTSCTVFYPAEGVSDIQRLQMTTTDAFNTHVIAVEGNFDDAQSGVKKLFASAEFAQQMSDRGKVLSSANSINFGRLVPQIVYYFSAYVDLVAQGGCALGDAVNFVVPTGNFGNILAGFYARSMGLPINRLICASNMNHVLTDFFATGTYDRRRLFYKTISPSMDILLSSNLERLLYEVADRDGSLVELWMNQLKDTGSYAVGDQRRDWLNSVFWGGFANDTETSREIRDMFEQAGYLCDTHTAVAGCVLGEYRRNTGDNRPAVIVSTASPYKFAPDVLKAIAGDESVNGADAFACAQRLQEISGIPVPKQVSMLRELPVCQKLSCKNDSNSMAEAVFQAFQS